MVYLLCLSIVQVILIIFLYNRIIKHIDKVREENKISHRVIETNQIDQIKEMGNLRDRIKKPLIQSRKV